MNRVALSRLLAIDQRIGYKLVRIGGKPHIKQIAMLRVIDGLWQVSGEAYAAPLAMTEPEAFALVQSWRDLPSHEITLCACCCRKCFTDEAKAFQISVGVGLISHGFWPEHYADELAAMQRDQSAQQEAA